MGFKKQRVDSAPPPPAQPTALPTAPIPTVSFVYNQSAIPIPAPRSKEETAARLKRFKLCHKTVILLNVAVCLLLVIATLCREDKQMFESLIGPSLILGCWYLLISYAAIVELQLLLLFGLGLEAFLGGVSVLYVAAALFSFHEHLWPAGAVRADRRPDIPYQPSDEAHGAQVKAVGPQDEFKTQ